MRLLVLLRFIPRQPWRKDRRDAFRKYLHFRLTTMYGNERPTKRVMARDLWRYLGWCARMDRLMR